MGQWEREVVPCWRSGGTNRKPLGWRQAFGICDVLLRKQAPQGLSAAGLRWYQAPGTKTLAAGG